ncbi:hypothetical protein ABT099_23400 [Streptomyces prasinus]|uniref:hypothetical protein n=1 Tax=Streptomyces prasinus TaxID=67345 RepID=UPI00332B3ECC
MAKPRRSRAESRFGTQDPSWYSDRIPHADKVDRDDPARTHILIQLHYMEQAGVEIDVNAVDIATKMGRARYQRAIEQRPVEDGDVPAWQKSSREAGDRPTVVYYIRIGRLVKIGTTMDPATRFTDLRPNEILAHEPGGEILEHQRHAQFKALRARGEYFHPGKPLQDHILRLRAERGMPSWKVNTVPDGCDYFPRERSV